MQWLVAGITNAEAAEADITSDYENAKSLMNKALYCFRQANNNMFVRKAKIHLESFNLRMKIIHDNQKGTLLTQQQERSAVDNQLVVIEREIEAVDMMENLLKENLLFEAKEFGTDIKKLLQVIYPSASFLESTLLQHLPGRGYAY